MKKKILFLILFFPQLLNAQFEQEIDSLQKSGNYYLGRFDVPYYVKQNNLPIDSEFSTMKVLIPEDVDITTIKSFYIILTINDTTSLCSSGGGSNNFLWTDEIVKYKFENNKTYVLIRIYWKFSDDRVTLKKGNLGTFSIRLLNKYTMTNYFVFSIHLLQEKTSE